jgi:predicted ATPase
MNGNNLDRIAGTVTRVEALRYRSLRYISQSLLPFQVLVGPNGSGKSTFLDVLAFLGDLLRDGLEAAVIGDARLSIPQRAPDAKHLLWMRKGKRFELAVEVSLPIDRRQSSPLGKSADICRYEIAIDVDDGPIRLGSEALWLKPVEKTQNRQRLLFPDPFPAQDTIIRGRPRASTPAGWKKVISRGAEPEQVTFRSETSGWNNPFKLDAGKAALMSLPADEERFPAATWFRQFVLDGIQRIVLASDAMRRPSPSSRYRGYLPDGSNLPWVVHELETTQPTKYQDWIRHVQEALPDIDAITTKERDEDRYRYLNVRYKSGLEAPSWLISDGTLRLLALTLIAYLPKPSGIYLIEEPENGIHPRAVETVFQSVSSVYGAQVLLATHSPVILSRAELCDLLCFARTSDGSTDIVRGNEHPRLKEWKGVVDLGSLFASGVLG